MLTALKKYSERPSDIGVFLDKSSVEITEAKKHLYISISLRRIFLLLLNNLDSLRIHGNSFRRDNKAKELYFILIESTFR